MLDINGREIPDNTPVEVPTRLRLPQSRASQIQAYIRAEMSRQAEDAGMETFDEANDLDVDGESLEFGITDYERSAEFGLGDVELLTSPADKGAALQAQEGGLVPPADAPRPAPATTAEAVK